MQYRFTTQTCIKRFIVTALASAGIMSAACAAPWPQHTVTIVVPFSAGGTTDIVARLIGDKLGQKWGQTVVVDNKLGAGGNIGTATVAKAKPDGYTILMASGSILTVNPHLYKDLPFDIKKDFAPITNVASGPMVVATSKQLKPKTLKALIAMAKKDPKKLNMGSAGLGSQVHMAGENFSYAAGIDMTHVPYRGEAASYTDLMAGQIDIVVGNIGAITPLYESGRINALAVTSKTRAAMLPDIPTASEAGLPGFENYGWFGFIAPAGTPADVIRKIQQDTAEVLQQPAIKKRLADQGMAGIGNTPEQFSKDIDKESVMWADVIAKRHISIAQ